MTVKTEIVTSTRTVIVIGAEIPSTRTLTRIKETNEIAEIDIDQKIEIVTNAVIDVIVVETRKDPVTQSIQDSRADQVLDGLHLLEVVTAVIVANQSDPRVTTVELVSIAKIEDGPDISRPLGALTLKRQPKRRKNRRPNLHLRLSLR